MMILVRQSGFDKFSFDYKFVMRIPVNVLKYISQEVGAEKTQRIGEDWFYLTLENFMYLDDGDEIGFINCDTGMVYMGHLFKEFSKDWRKIRIYYSTVRRVQSRVIEVEVGRNLFFFNKIKDNDAFSVFYMLRGLEKGRLKVRGSGM